MLEKLKRFLGDGPYPCPLEKFIEFADIYLSDKMIIIMRVSYSLFISAPGQNR